MSEAEHWTANAERRWKGRYIGEDDRGEFWVPPPRLDDEVIWSTRFNPRNPLHWPVWLRSRLRNRIVVLE
jgi:hypothetical protein